MAVITRANLKIRLGIPSTDTSEDDALDALITQVTALCEAYLGFPIEQAVALEFYSGTGRSWLPLRRKPVTIVVAEADTTDGGTTVSGLTSTQAASIIASMPVVGDGIPVGATVASVGGTSVVISSAATATATDARLAFGLAVWLDTGAGRGGQGDDSFADETLLGLGQDVVLDARQGTTAGVFTSYSGMLMRAGNVWTRPLRREGGLLAPFAAGPLADGALNVKVVYTAGWAAASIPADIQLAVMDTIALARLASPFGTFLSSESWDGYSRTLAGLADMAWLGYLSGAGGANLARYKRLSV